MAKLSELSLYARFKWAVPVVPTVKKDEGFFSDPKPWDFEEPVLGLIEQMFVEIEEFFSSKNMPVEMAIYEIREVFDRLHVEMYSPHQEVYMIVEKYKKLSENLF
ncbi:MULTISPECIES: hypothetical protein [Paenibacillus]|uniref:hypothetical protein n=1 Tax=Paenibacillus TaxID=44249 RepID=UPI0011A53B23|nr:hypothetical protein [Paenibacillus sp. IHBB 10380]